MRTVRLPDGTDVPALGQGTWNIGEDRARAGEIAALRRGIELGMTLIDTAEMYGDGAAENSVAEAIAGLRDQVFLVSKVYPQNASGAAPPRACERSLKRLRTDRIDLYLLHWRGGTPLSETVEAFERLRKSGKILRWGVSNFDVDDMKELPPGCAANQILYNPEYRGIEFDLLPWSTTQHIPLMAYSPVGQAGKTGCARLHSSRSPRATTPPQPRSPSPGPLRHPGIISIPKSGSPAHIDENAAAAEIILSAEDLADIDRAYPAPLRQTAPVHALMPIAIRLFSKSWRRPFFFEKKKQKTFIHCRRHGVQTGEFRAIRNR